MTIQEQLYTEIEKESMNLLQKLIKNKCVNFESKDSGNEIKSVNTLVKYFESYGIKDYEIFEPETGRGNLLVTLPGSINKKSLTLQSHLDVVPVTGDWSVDPFSGEIKDGWIYGRGALDMLVFTTTQAVTFAKLYESGWKPEGTLKFLAVADEEAGGKYGAKWLVENEPEKIKSDYLLGELGGGIIETPSGSKMGVMNAEKGPGWVQVKIKGEAGHGSIPYKTANALEIMGNLITNIRNNPPKATITREWKEFIHDLHLGKLSNYLLTHRRTVDYAIKKVEKKDQGLAKVFNALTRMTVSPNVGNAGKKVNIIPDEAILQIDARLLPGQTKDDVISHISSMIPKEKSAELEMILCDPGTSDAWNTDFTKIMSESYQEIHPDQNIVPFFVPGVTDARFYRRIGIKCYGAIALTNKVTIGLFTKLYHGVDERVPIEAFKESVQFYTSISKKYLN